MSKIIIEALKVMAVVMIFDIIFYAAFGIVPIQWDVAGICYGLGLYAAAKAVKKGVMDHMHH